MNDTRPQMRDGNLEIGLTYYQEQQWINAMKLYGPAIVNKALLSAYQKEQLIKNCEAISPKP